MFRGCSGLTSLDLSLFNTSKVFCMNDMFNGCESLTTLDLSSFNTSNVNDMRYMFNGCSNLTSLDLSNFNFEETLNVSSMMYNVGTNAENKPIPVKVTEEGYDFFTSIVDCGKGDSWKFVKPDGTDWVTE